MALFGCETVRGEKDAKMLKFLQADGCFASSKGLHH